MPCRTCGHTLSNLGISAQRVFWCPRCGSLLIEKPGFEDAEAPKVVQHARNFLAGMRKPLTDSEINALVTALAESVGLLEFVRGAADERQEVT